MIVYVPTPITSVEQAEALPIGTSVKRAVWQQRGHQEHYAGVKVGTNTWFTTSPTADLQDALSRHMIGWTALLPIEAEEEAISVQTRGQAHPDWRTRLTTPWKWIDGPSPDRRGDCA